VTNINLYDPSLRVRTDHFALPRVLAVVAIAALATAVLAVVAGSSLSRADVAAQAVASELQAEQAAMQVALAKAGSKKADAALQAEVARSQRLLIQRRAALQMLAGDQGAPTNGFAGRLESLGRQSVDGLWLTGLALRQDDVLLRGRALDPALIPLYVQRLEHEPSLEGRAFKALDVARPLLPVPKPVPGGPERPEGIEPPPPRRADYVEFTLTGPGAAASSATAKESAT
jgi:hypothetical protein